MFWHFVFVFVPSRYVGSYQGDLCIFCIIRSNQVGSPTMACCLIRCDLPLGRRGLTKMLTVCGNLLTCRYPLHVWEMKLTRYSGGWSQPLFSEPILGVIVTIPNSGGSCFPFSFRSRKGTIQDTPRAAPGSDTPPSCQVPIFLFLFVYHSVFYKSLCLL